MTYKKGESHKPKIEVNLMDGYRNERGMYRTASLFVETNQNKKNNQALYTLKPYDMPGLPSLYLKFMEAPTEYIFVMECFKSMGQWRKIKKLKWFQEGLINLGFAGFKIWEEDKRAKEEADIILNAKAAAEEGNVPAMKMLYDRINPKDSKRGRPSKDEIDKKIAHNNRVAENLKEVRTSILNMKATNGKEIKAS